MLRTIAALSIFLGLLALTPWSTAMAEDTLVLEGKDGPGKGKHVVLLSGDEEYRSEEALPMLAKILSQRHGFKCTVLFALDKDGTINPTNTHSLPGAEALDSADAIIMLLRFREWPDDQMKHFVDAFLAGKPIIALRTSTHAFNYAKDSKSPYAKYHWANGGEWKGGFGKQVLGETWVAHHGAHKKEAARGIIQDAAKDDPILRGVSDLFADSDVYTAKPPEDVKVLVKGAVLKGMSPKDEPVEGPKNNPMQPVIWTREFKNEAGKTNKILCSTMGAATDLKNEGLRRVVVNATYAFTGLEVPASADVTLVDEYKPTMYGFNTYTKGLKIEAYKLGATWPANAVPGPEWK